MGHRGRLQLSEFVEKKDVRQGSFTVGDAKIILKGRWKIMRSKRPESTRKDKDVFRELHLIWCDTGIDKGKRARKTLGRCVKSV